MHTCCCKRGWWGLQPPEFSFGLCVPRALFATWPPTNENMEPDIRGCLEKENGPPGTPICHVPCYWWEGSWVVLWALGRKKTPSPSCIEQNHGGKPVGIWIEWPVPSDSLRLMLTDAPLLAAIANQCIAKLGVLNAQEPSRPTCGCRNPALEVCHVFLGSLTSKPWRHRCSLFQGEGGQTLCGAASLCH